LIPQNKSPNPTSSSSGSGSGSFFFSSTFGAYLALLAYYDGAY